jgi:hypothetical protein
MQPANNITAYHLQKLEEVGYRGIQTVNSTDITSNLIDPQTNETIQTVPAKFVEMIYSTASTPNETKRGYFVLTSTNATGPNLQSTMGYSVLYEGNSSSTAAEITTTAASLPPPPAVGQVFDSFELIAAPEIAQAAQEGDDDDNGGDDDDNGGDDDDNGGDDDDNGGDDDDNDDNGEGDEGEGGGGGEGNPNEFDDCVVPPGLDPGDVGC